MPDPTVPGSAASDDLGLCRLCGHDYDSHEWWRDVPMKHVPCPSTSGRRAFTSPGAHGATATGRSSSVVRRSPTPGARTGCGKGTTMAGSYGHIVDEQGRFAGIKLIDNLGDAYEALEECYGMIWLLAGGEASVVEDARTRYAEGLLMSPGSPDE